MAVSRFLDVPQARKCLILLGFAKPFDYFGGEGGHEKLFFITLHNYRKTLRIKGSGLFCFYVNLYKST